MDAARPDRTTLAAFAAVVLAGGSNMVAVRVSDSGLAPFWGATLRFAIAAGVVLVILRARRLPLPRGRAFAFAAAYGFLTFGLSFALFYWGVVRVPAGMAGVVMASTPLLSFLLAVGHRLEPFRWRGLAGAVLAIAGILTIFAGQRGSGAPIASILAILGSAACAAESGIVLKRAPQTDPVAMNAAAMLVGMPILFALSLVAHERLPAPAHASTWAALLFMGLIGTPVLFVLFVFVLDRWTVSATSYQFVLVPVVAIALAWALIHEPLTMALALGSPLVLAGVWVGALAPDRAPVRAGHDAREG